MTEQTGQVLDKQTAVGFNTADDTLYDFTRNVILASGKRMKAKYPIPYRYLETIFAQLLPEAAWPDNSSGQ